MKKLRKLLRGDFTKNVLLITGGTAFAQVINTLVSPVITRIYPPEQYGVLTVYTSILSMLAIVASLKYEWGIPIADDEEKAINVLSLSVITLFIVTSFIAILLVFWGNPVLSFLNGEVLIKYKFLIPLGVFFTGLYNILTQWAYRKQNYKSITKTKLSQSVTQNIVKVSFGLLKIGPIGLILGRIFGQSAGITSLSMPLIREGKTTLKSINKINLIWVAKRYKKFPIFSAPGQFLNIAGLQLPVLFITALYGNEVIGLYGLANSIVNIPMNLIGNSIADVFYGEAASVGKTDPKRLKKLSVKLFKRSLLIGLIPFLVLTILGPYLFSFIFGAKWYSAGIYARIIALLVFCRLIFTPITRIFSVFEKQKESLVLDGLRVILILMVFVVSYILKISSYQSIGLYTIAMSFVYFITFIYAQRILDNEINL